MLPNRCTEAQPAHMLLLAVGASKRVRLLQAARSQLGLPPAELIEWRDYLAQPSLLEAALARKYSCHQPCYCKIEPPGEDPVAHQRLLQDGCEILQRPALPPLEYGQLLAADVWFAGFTAALQRVAQQLAQLPENALRVFNAPQELLLMADKLACQQHFAAREIATPLLLGLVTGYEHLQQLLAEHQLDRVYLKPRYGSSAAGVVAYRRSQGGSQQALREQAISSTQLLRGETEQDGHVRLFNCKRMSCYETKKEIALLVDALAAQQLYAESWISKPRYGQAHFDFRVLTLGGRAAHRVARIGAHTVTNLHLDNQRGDVASLLDACDIVALEQCAAAAAACFPASHVIGLDVVLKAGRARVLEANGFGDLLPGLLWQGDDSYAAQMRSFSRSSTPATSANPANP